MVLPRIRSQHGFSLVELSIVLAVIGLLIGGVMGGRALINRSKLTGVVADLGKYKTAYFKFKEQYSALPGDMIDATEYWGLDNTATACTNSPAAGDRVIKKLTCNGSGDGKYIGYNAGGEPDTNYVYEMFRAWQHLANAGFIDGSFTGVAGSGSAAHAVENENSPAGSYAQSALLLKSSGYLGTADTARYSAYYGTELIYGKTNSSTGPNSPLLTPREMSNLDTKLDDGLPAYGKILPYKSSWNPNCTSSDTAASAQYNISGTYADTVACSINYILEVINMQRHAFTLVELSIVLVVIGLLVGGILAGQSMIRSAALRYVPTQAQKYTAAAQLFVQDYTALPGDMKNAQDYWGVAHATASNCVTTASTGTETCNGDGNGVLDASTGSREYFRFWQHLANAGLIDGRYNGIAAAGSTGSNSTNVPSGKISNSYWFAYGSASIATGFTITSYGNWMSYGLYSASDWPKGGLMTGEDAKSIDAKVDDGKPGTGQIMANWSGCTGSADGSDPLVAEYVLGSNSTNCMLFWPKAFELK